MTLQVGSGSGLESVTPITNNRQRPSSFIHKLHSKCHFYIFSFLKVTNNEVPAEMAICEDHASIFGFSSDGKSLEIRCAELLGSVCISILDTVTIAHSFDN